VYNRVWSICIAESAEVCHIVFVLSYCEHTFLQIQMHARTNTCTLSHAHFHTFTCMHISTHKHVRAHTHMRIHACAHAHTHSCTHTCTHRLTYSHTHALPDPFNLINFTLGSRTANRRDHNSTKNPNTCSHLATEDISQCRQHYHV
jgi:hypothetical protein